MQPADHHGEEVAHDPLEHHGEDEEHGADEEEDAAAGGRSLAGSEICPLWLTYTTGEKPWAPPQPMRMMEKVNVEMTKLCLVSLPSARQQQTPRGITHPTNPSAVGLANRLL